MNLISPLILITFLSLTSAAVRPTPTNLNDPTKIFLNETFYTGTLPIEDKGSIFYWLCESRRDSSNDPLVLWITGGPGCSGEIALLYENGPYTINDDFSLKLNPYSWNNIANVLFIDQPLGTGYSVATQLDRDEDAVATDFYIFFTEFLETFPEYKKRPFYITGESFAGHFIPIFGTYLLQKNNPDINFLGAAIGNGWVDPYNQVRSFPEYAFHKKLVSREQFKDSEDDFIACQKLLEDTNIEYGEGECIKWLAELVGIPPSFNFYDVRLPCIGELCYNFSGIKGFLGREDVQKVLNVTGLPWGVCARAVGEALYSDNYRSYSDKVAQLLEAGIPVLVYSGDKDFVCNYIGGEMWTNAMKWSGQKPFQSMIYRPYEKYGQFKSYDGLIFLRIYNAGHLVPMDQPKAAIDMLERFINGWDDYKEKSIVDTYLYW